MPYKNRNQRKYRGLCRDCSNKTIPRLSLCLKHNLKYKQRTKLWHDNHPEYNSKVSKRWRQRWEGEGKCIRCGVPLIEGERKLCVNCNMFSHSISVKGVLHEINREAIASKS